LLAACLLTSTTRAGDPPRRVVSLNLCADQLLMALADPAQIGSLSFMARDASISFMAGEARHFPIDQASAETVLLDPPDLVLAGPYDAPLKRDLLKARGIATLILPPWTNFEEGRTQIRELAHRLGHPERGEALIARIDAALARARNIAPKRSLLVLERRGWTIGSDGTLGEAIRLMGLVPAGGAYGLPDGGLVRLERIVAHPPDYALVTDDDPGADPTKAIDLGTAYFAHPALARVIPSVRRLRIDGRLTICEGPATPAMIDALAAEIRAKVR
jgi:iron complex transport system substrate-binding protein